MILAAAEETEVVGDSVETSHTGEEDDSSEQECHISPVTLLSTVDKQIQINKPLATSSM